jgi:predicted methyltransferase
MTTDIATFLETQSVTTMALPSIAAPLSGAPRNTILHGDCLDVLPQLPAGSVDFVLTDPPLHGPLLLPGRPPGAERRQ